MKTPDANQTFRDTQAEIKSLRLIDSSMDLTLLGSDKPLMKGAYVTRTFRHPDTGITTVKQASRVVLGACGHQITSVADAAGLCQSISAHGRDPIKRLVCKKCLPPGGCQSCGGTFCRACLRERDGKLLCSACRRKRFIRIIGHTIAALCLLTFFEPDTTERT